MNRTESISKIPPYGLLVVGTMSVAISLGISMNLTIGLLLPDITESLHLSPIEKGWLGSSVIIGQIMFAIPFALWLSRYRPWRVLSASLLSGGLLIFLQGLAPGFAILLVTRIAFGMAFIAAQPARAILIQQWIPVRKIVLVYGAHSLIFSLILFVAAITTPFLIIWLDGWRNTIFAIAVIYTGVALFWVFFGRERITPQYREMVRSQARTPLNSIVRYKTLWIGAMTLLVADLTWVTLPVFWPTYALEEFGLPVTRAGIILSTALISSAPTSLLFTFVPAFVNRRREVLITCTIVISGSMVGMLHTGSFPLLMGLAIAMGLAWGYIPLLLTIPYELPGIKPRELAVAWGFFQTLSWVGGGIGPVLTGSLQQATDSLFLALLVIALANLLVIVGALRLPRRFPPEAAVTEPLVATSPVPQASLGDSEGGKT